MRNVIYLITCKTCQKQYVGSTTNFKACCTLYNSFVQHFRKTHSWSDFQIQPIEKVYLSEELNDSEKEKKLLARERHWMAELRCIYLGLNDRNDL